VQLGGHTRAAKDRVRLCKPGGTITTLETPARNAPSAHPEHGHRLATYTLGASCIFFM